MATNGNGTKVTLFIFASIVFPTLFFMGNGIIANDKTRQTEDKEINIALVKGDNCNRADFLEAIEKLTDEQKRDNREIVRQLGILTTEIAVLKKEIQK